MASNPTSLRKERRKVPANQNGNGEFHLLSQLKVQPVDWLWQNRIPRGELTVFDGDPSTNKSSLAVDLGARVSTGTEMPDGTVGSKGGVVLLQAEDSVRKTLLLRATAAGADLDQIAVIEHATIPDDMAKLEAAIKEVGARLIVIDPLMCFVTQNANKEQAMRQALMPLRDLAERHSLAIILVRHLSKSGGKNALYRGMGSIAIAAVVRAGFLVAPSPKDPHMRVLCHWKSNLGPTTPSLLFEPVAGDDGQMRIVWHGECDYSARDLYGKPEANHAILDEAKRCLQDILTDGPVEHRIVLEKTTARGLSLRTVERAKADLNVVSRRKGFGPGSTVHWAMPKCETQNPSNSHTPPAEPLAVYDPEKQDLHIDTSHDDWIEESCEADHGSRR
jgi:hypothetical protein